jgi:diguanylate cyclase (GGDEF)-like protein
MKFSKNNVLLRNWILASLGPSVLILCAVLYQTAGLWNSPDNWLVENRMRFSKTPAQQEIVFLAIDKKTLDRVGVWPWPRSIIAETIDQLVASEALEVFLDIDFSARSTDTEDALLAESLRNADGTVILAAFSQSDSVTSDSVKISESLPLMEFQENSWLATVNVKPDVDGIVRKFPYGQTINGEALLSVPAVLSGKTGPPGSYFDINFSIDPKNVPTYSLVDFLDEKLPKTAFAQKSVVVGAHALELRDSLAVPVYGTLSGTMLQIIATETLRQNMELVHIVAIWPILLCGLLQIVALLTLHRRHVTLRLCAVGCLSIGAEAAGYFLFSHYAYVLPTAAIHSMNAVMLVLLAVREMDLRRYMTLVANAHAANATNLLRQVFDDSVEAIMIVDEKGNILEASPKSKTIFTQNGCAPASRNLPEKILKDACGSIAKLKMGESVSTCEGEVILGDGGNEKIIEFTVTPSCLENTDDPVTSHRDGNYVACIMARDVSQKRKQAQRLEFLSTRDELTGAYRRHAFIEILDRKLSQLHNNQCCQILVFNLNRFKTINTTLGRDAGDQLLCAVVTRLENAQLGIECVARLLGDTFAILLKSTDEQYLLKAKSEATAKLLEETYFLDELSISIDVRISYLYSETIASAEEMLQRAELALDECTSSGKQSIRGLDPVSTAQHKRAREIERDMKSALENGDFKVFYQPQVDVNDRRLVGTEALARWTHPTLGQVLPDEFIRIAEASGTIGQLGRWVLNTACQEAVTWRSPLKLAVNVSPMQFMRGDIVSDIEVALDQSGLPADRLQLEITESSLLEGDDQLMDRLHAIRLLGVSLALDDFGTGYASLGYISRFPVDMIKVDQSFIRTLTTDLTSQSIVQFTKTLSEVLNLKMLCEGVETEQQMKYLHLIGCDQAQGYLFGQPQNADDIRDLIAQSQMPGSKERLRLATA